MVVRTVIPACTQDDRTRSSSRGAPHQAAVGLKAVSVWQVGPRQCLSSRHLGPLTTDHHLGNLQRVRAGNNGQAAVTGNPASSAKLLAGQEPEAGNRRSLQSRSHAQPAQAQA